MGTHILSFISKVTEARGWDDGGRFRSFFRTIWKLRRKSIGPGIAKTRTGRSEIKPVKEQHKSRLAQLRTSFTKFMSLSRRQSGSLPGGPNLSSQVDRSLQRGSPGRCKILRQKAGMRRGGQGQKAGQITGDQSRTEC